MVENRFGGSWTHKKILCLSSYLRSYSESLKKQKFKKIYIDPFCGSGSWSNEDNLVAELLDQEDIVFNPGSPLTVLQFEENLDEFYFNDSNPEFIIDLRSSLQQFKSKKIFLNCEEANSFIVQIVKNVKKFKVHGVMFLDPFGLQIDWETLKIISKTEAMDIVMLFPSSSLCRMLPNADLPSEAWQSKLDRFLGTQDWKDFYHTEQIQDLFGSIERTERRAGMTEIMNFVTNRLRELFFVVDRTLDLKNSRGSSLFHLIFLCANRSESAQKLVNKLAKGAIDFANKELSHGRRK